MEKKIGITDQGGADGLSHSRSVVQRLRNPEEAEAQYLYTLRRARPDLAVKIQQTLETKARPPKTIWRPKQTKADAQASTDADAETSAGTNTMFRISSEIDDPRHGEHASVEPRHHNDGKLGYGFTSADTLEEIEEVKKGIKQMLDAGCLRPYRYTEWTSNVVLTKKRMADGASL
ncbi:hypothetical protein QYE76_026962 [Lolium multiflorum]|uniref:Uncharacterized protein n=1 Tax=Lolium multiflorum TaxID=4521 RepID=A0AAD8QLX4_LOLMU|nr:hypothetical protein QYE76_026962 [Lolium multiflorum]